MYSELFSRGATSYAPKLKGSIGSSQKQILFRKIAVFRLPVTQEVAGSNLLGRAIPPCRTRLADMIPATRAQGQASPLFLGCRTAS